MEIWKTSLSMVGYEISNMGNIRHGERKVNLSPTDNGYGYLFVSKKHNRCKVNHYVHRLVAEVFFDNPFGYNEVNHLDCDKHNNNADNLEWCSRVGNIRHAIQNNRIVYSNERWAKLEQSRLQACAVNMKPVEILINGEWIQCKSNTCAGKMLGVSITTINRSIRGNANACRSVRVRSV